MMVVKNPTPPARPPSLKQMHARRCFLLGITSPEKVAKLWTEESARIAAARKDARKGG